MVDEPDLIRLAWDVIEDEIDLADCKEIYGFEPGVVNCLIV